MIRTYLSSRVGTLTSSPLLADEVRDVPDYLPVMPAGLTSGHKACTGCGLTPSISQALAAIKLLGRRPIVVMATGCMEVTTSTKSSCLGAPEDGSAWGEVTFFHNNFPNAASTGSGVVAAYRHLSRQGLVDPDSFVVLEIGGDGGTYDIGLQALSGAMERGEDFVYLCLNNQAYMNTGIQSSGATLPGTQTATDPVGRVVPGKSAPPKYLIDIAVAHNIPYAATANPVYRRDFMVKMQKAARIKGPAVIEVYGFCPEGWKTETEDMHLVSALAVESRLFPLYEVETDFAHGERLYTLSHAPRELVPVERFLAVQGRFKKMLAAHPETVRRIQDIVDNRWSFWEPVYRANDLTPVYAH